MYNGFRTRVFDVLSGVAQCSPLSPLVYNLCCQPLASSTSSALGPSNSLEAPPPISHQHADDMTLHVLEADDLPAALNSVHLFCTATSG